MAKGSQWNIYILLKFLILRIDKYKNIHSIIKYK